MAILTDPMPALVLFQEALSAGEIPTQRCALNPNLVFAVDEPKGLLRYNYMAVEEDRITALVMLVLVDPLRGKPCYQMGCAVPKDLRRQGRAKALVRAALAELEHGLKRNGEMGFYVEGIVGLDNTASQRVARATLSESPEDVTDSVSGVPALHYVRGFGSEQS